MERFGLADNEELSGSLIELIKTWNELPFTIDEIWESNAGDF